MNRDTYNDTTGMSVMLTAEAQMDQLIHSIVTALNDILAPNVEAGQTIEKLAGAGTTSITVTLADGTTRQIDADTKILDAENCCVGSDEALPPRELFVRTGCPRYTTVYGDDGKTYYVYNEEDPKDTAMQYTTGSIKVNPELLESESLLPAYSQNGKPGELPVSYELGKALSDIWEQDFLYLSPHDTTPCTFSEFYMKMTGELSTLGDVFESTSRGLEGTALATDNSRQQVIGVSSDEELTNMIKYQNAYNASSRFINVISEMIETIIRQMG